MFLATVTFPDEGQERLCGFFGVVQAMGLAGWLRGHRTVVLPDFQGLGIGNAMIERVAEWLWEREGKRFRATTAAPAIVAHRRRHPELWRLVQRALNHEPSASDMRSRKDGHRYRVTTAAGRLTTVWEYVPTALRDALPPGQRTAVDSSRSARKRAVRTLRR